MKKYLCVLLALLSHPVFAQSVVPTRPIPAQSVIAQTDISPHENTVPGGVSQIADIVGLEARVTLYPGRPIMIGDVGPPALVDRNEIVRLVFRSGALSILTEGRALDRAAAGERIRIMNIDSRTTIVGVLMDDKTVEVRR